MIINFSVRNFRSIRDEQTLSFEASKNKDYEEYMVVNIGEKKKYRLLKMIALFGNNASGKTNVLAAMDCLRYLAIHTRERGEPLPFVPFMFDEQSINENSQMSITFLVRTGETFTKYRYAVEFNSQMITREKLDCYTSAQPSLVYLRETVRDGQSSYKTTVQFGRSIHVSQAERKAILINTLENMTVLSVFRKINLNFSAAKDVFDWFREKTIGLVSPQTPLEHRATEYFSKKGNNKFTLSFLRNSDFSISAIDFIKQEVPVPQILTPREDIETIEIDTDVSIRIGLRKQEMVRPEFTHFYKNEAGNNKDSILPIDVESNGTIRAFGLSAPIHKSLAENRLLLIDEIEASLHTRIVEYMLLVFLVNSKESQIVFTTHNTSLMRSDFMRPDVIWFTEKDESGATELYPLTGFNDVKMPKVLDQYEAGRFGAYPHVWKYKLDVDGSANPQEIDQ